jgi:hypothetical protein
MRSFGVFLQQERPIAELLDWAGRFDEAGAGSVWVADHLANRGSRILCGLTAGPCLLPWRVEPPVGSLFGSFEPSFWAPRRDSWRSGLTCTSSPQVAATGFPISGSQETAAQSMNCSYLALDWLVLQALWLAPPEPQEHAQPGRNSCGGADRSQPQARWLIHTDTWAGSRTWCTTPVRSSRTESSSTASFSRAANAATVLSAS